MRTIRVGFSSGLTIKLGKTVENTDYKGRFFVGIDYKVGYNWKIQQKIPKNGYKHGSFSTNRYYKDG